MIGSPPDTPNDMSNSKRKLPLLERIPSHTNNSDDEDLYDKGVVDYVSFPTIPDPEVENTKSITGLLTKTLRKVTTNASTLVQNYSQNYTSPKPNVLDTSPFTNRVSELRATAIGSDASPVPKNDEIVDTPISMDLSTKTDTRLRVKEDTSKRITRSSSPLDLKGDAQGNKLEIMNPIIKSETNRTPIDKVSIVTNETSTGATFKPQQSKQPPSTSTPALSLRQNLIDEAHTPRVTSDNKTLRISTMQFPRMQSMANSTTSSVVNVTALASVDIDNVTNDKSNVESKPTHKKESSIDLKSKDKGLQNKISSIFNNLPNDIELSDDSADELDSTHNEGSENSATPQSDIAYIENRSDSNLSSISKMNNHLQFELGARYGDSVAKSAPIKAESKHSATFTPSFGQSPTVSTFHAIQNKDVSANKQKSLNTPSTLLDNARSIIHQNIEAVASSASSIIASKRRKKKKPTKTSENPLKNGGIPKKYWMNDAFVSDCLNCFRPFTAFRRKHHCRFCGQIFCSDCTLFISYNQHRDERNNTKNSAKKPYNDKLRVCKPCYSDVIIYLSDDSSSANDSDGEKVISAEEIEVPKTKAEDLLVPNHPLSRIRSMSMGSNRDSSRTDSLSRKPLLKDNNNLENSLSTSHSSSPSRSNNNQFIYPDESIKVHPRQAPRMAIPTTRTGEAVEIPLMRHSLMNSSILKTSGAPYSSNMNSLPQTFHQSNSQFYHNHHLLPEHPQYGQKQNLLQQHQPQGGHFHNHYHNTYSNLHSQYNNSAGISESENTNKTRIKSHLSPTLSNANLTSRSLDNLGSIYNSFMTRTPSFNMRVLSGSSRDPSRFRRELSLEPGDIQSIRSRYGKEMTIGGQSDFDDDDGDDDDDDDDDDENAKNEGVDLSDNEEDEHAMSIYTSLNETHGYGSTLLAHQPPPMHSHSAVTVPTLGEFPIMKSGYPLFRGAMNRSAAANLANVFQNHSIELTGEDPSKHQPENIRSRARAHASLQRMRTRRQAKATRNVLILSQSNLRLPSLEPSNHRPQYTSSLTPIASPASPGGNSSNLTAGIAATDDASTSSANIDSEMSPLGPQISASTGLEKYHSGERNDYFGLDDHLMATSESRDLISWKDGKTVDNKDKLYNETLDFVLRQSLKDGEIETDIERWVAVLQKLLGYIDEIKLTDTLDIRQYVKIKKVLGGKIEQTELVDGLFMTKNIDSKRMASKISNPRIALLMFPIEYLKQKEQFISLRIIHAQQSVYITNLVSRLVSMEPDIIVVGDSVSGLAEKLFEDAGITVISNVKPQVIERISRYTKADIFQSVNDLFFKKGKLGLCENFAVKRYKYQNQIKTFVFFTGCDIHLGFTISIRGGNNNLLNNVKYAAETLMPGYINARFEKSFLDNLLLSYVKPTENPKIVDIQQKLQEIRDNTIEGDENGKLHDLKLDPAEVVNYVKLFSERKLSLSPPVEYSLPNPLAKTIYTYYAVHQFAQQNAEIQKLSSVDDIKEEWLTELKIDYKLEELPGKEANLLNILKFASEAHLKLLINEYQARVRIWSNCMKYPSYQLYPICHRNIHLLHSTVSIKHATPCSGPAIIVIDYYTDNDKCFGLFLDQAFHESLKVCGECGEPYLDHYKSYVHGKAKVDLIIEKYDIQCLNNGEMQGKNQRVMWSYCKECNYETPIIAMSDETYYLSIGKFFELNFYGESVSGGCTHDFFKSYVKCFGFNNLVIRLEYSTIDNYEIVVPKKQLEFITNIDIKLKIDAYKFIRTKAEVFFDSVLKRLKRVKLDTFEKAEDGIQKIEELKIKLQEQSDSIYGRLQSIYDKIIPTNYLALNVVLRDLQKLGIYWDNEFNEFERTYLPSENEVNKITQFHLRKFLMDRYNDEDEDNNNNNNKKVVDVTENESTSGSKETAALDDGKASSNKDCSDKSTPDNSQDSMEIDGDSKNTDDKSTNELLKPFPEFVPKKPRELSMNRNLSDSNIETKMFPQSTLYELGSNISERINKWNQTAETGDKTTPTQLLTHRGSDSSLKSINTVIPSQNKVIHLANFFDKMYYDQISLEFSKQRERELKRKSKVKAQPIFDSKPIVEIYNKIEDVVGPGVDDEKKKDIAVVKKDEQEKGQTTENQQELSQQQLQQQVQQQLQQLQQQLDIPEKQSLLKSLTNFWADRAATLWDPLNYPLESHEHTFADSEVIVREDEPSSLVAFCLSSNDYKQKIKNAFEKNRMGDSGILNLNLQENKPHNDKPGVELEVGNSGITTESASIVTSVGDTKLEESSINNSSNAKAGESLLASDNKKGAQFAKIEKKFKKKLNKEGGINGGGGGTNNSGDNNNNDDNINPLESILTRNKSNHLKYQFIDGNTNLSCKIFYSEQFEALRKACGNDDNFIQSLSRCVKWQSSGGKSGSSFLKTLDNRYILKELSKLELESFVSIAPFYFKYISQSMFNTLTTAIAKIFGFYQVQIKNTTTGKIFRMDFLIMENLFYNHKTTRIFDLKGSMRNRHVQQTGKENEVLLDENMIEYIYESPVFVGQQLKKLLRGCLFNDTSFLSAMDVMDYSLVIGIDDSSKKLYLGIIDWLRTFTWDKKVENWVKGNNLIGGNKRGKDPTIVTPKQYRIRFREAMERYILEAPDIWYEGSK